MIDSVNWFDLGINPSMTRVAPVREPAREHRISTIVFDKRLPCADYGSLYFDSLDQMRKGDIISTHPRAGFEVVMHYLASIMRCHFIMHLYLHSDAFPAYAD